MCNILSIPRFCVDLKKLYILLIVLREYMLCYYLYEECFKID